MRANWISGTQTFTPQNGRRGRCLHLHVFGNAISAGKTATGRWASYNKGKLGVRTCARVAAVMRLGAGSFVRHRNWAPFARCRIAKRSVALEFARERKGPTIKYCCVLARYSTAIRHNRIMNRRTLPSAVLISTSLVVDCLRKAPQAAANALKVGVTTVGCRLVLESVARLNRLINYNSLIWRIRLRRIRWFEHRECVWCKEQQPEHECYNSRFNCFHIRTLSLRFFCCHGASARFCRATQERIVVPPFGRCRRSGRSRCGQTERIVVLIFISNEGLRTTSREGRENLPNVNSRCSIEQTYRQPWK